MRYELINTGSYLLVVSDDEIKESDIFYMNNDVIDCTYIKVKPKGDAKKIIAHLPLNGAAILDLPLLPPLEQEDDDYLDGCEVEFVNGFRKAREKYKYTEEDMRKAMKYVSEITNNKMKYMEEFIQSLSQPKMPVAFECEVEHIGSQEDGDFEEPKKYTNSQGQTVLIGRYIYE